MNLITSNSELNLTGLRQLTRRPPLFAKDPINFWQDPYISDHILFAHLDEDTDQGSRKYSTIMESVLWIAKYLDLVEGSKLLDLGCGPGLYSEQFMGQGFEVTGMDFSENSINHARMTAQQNQWPIKYICSNYLEMEFKDEFDVITLIYGDLCVLSHHDRYTLLKKVRRALKPGGYLVCDVFTKNYFQEREPDKSWFISMEDGFWKPDQHVVLQQHFKYRKEKVRLDKYTVIQKDGTMHTYHIWKHYFSPARIQATLEDNGFTMQELFSDLCGTPLQAGSQWLGVVARKE